MNDNRPSIIEVIARLKAIAAKDKQSNPELSWSGEVFVTYAASAETADDQAEHITTICISGTLNNERRYVAGYEGYSPAPFCVVAYPLDDPQTAEGWTPPSANEIGRIIDLTPISQEVVARRAGLSLNRLKRIIGRQSPSSTGSGAPVRFGEWLALVRVCS